MASLGDCFAHGLWGSEVLPGWIFELSLQERDLHYGQALCSLLVAALWDFPVDILAVQSFLVNWDQELHFHLKKQKWIHTLPFFLL